MNGIFCFHVFCVCGTTDCSLIFDFIFLLKYPYHYDRSSAGGGDGFSLSSVNFAQLHKKLGDLEEENNLLRQEVCVYRFCV